MLDQRDHMQVPNPVAALAALLAHPEFQQGLAEAQKYFLNDFFPEPLSEEEMIEEVELNLTAEALEHERLFNETTPSYFCLLGYVVGIIAQGLSYAGSCPAREKVAC